MHLKNFSLRETEPASRQFRLAEAYDLLPVQLILPEDEEQMALTLNGKKRNIRKKDFAAFAERCGILEKSAEHMIKRVCSLREKMKEQCSRSFLPPELIQKLKNLIDRRIEILS